MLTQENARERVARGAALLDRNRPGWTDAISLGELDLYSMTHCIVGQLCGKYKPEALGVPKSETGAQYGFDIDCGAGERFSAYAVLQDAWIEAIADRLVPTVAESTSVDAVDPHAGSTGRLTTRV